ncbi:MAG: GNAT family N-acetyltransferase [Methanobacterium sp.]|nr:GNAT family N-acetyltransferase [Methanobacterium sp.]
MKKRIHLKPARFEDRKKAYEWLYFSDFSSYLNELTAETSEGAVPTLSQFKEDYAFFFFDGSRPEKGRAYLIILEDPNFKEEIGFITYTAFHLRDGIAEIDIWLKSLEYAGKGYGTEALKILTHELFKEKYNTIIIRPCLENVRAVNSYKKAGFKVTNFQSDYYKKEYLHQFAAGDCKNGEDLFMVLKK